MPSRRPRVKRAMRTPSAGGDDVVDAEFEEVDKDDKS